MRERLGEGAGWLMLLGAVIGVLLLGMAPTPYLIERPGTSVDTLGEVPTGDDEEVPLITIDGAESYETEGRLDLVTVRVDGSPGYPTSWIQVLAAWFDAGSTVLPVEALYPSGTTEEDSAEQSAAQMEASQRDAVAAALGELGIPFEGEVTVEGVLEGSPAEGLVEAGDEVVAVNGEPVPTDGALRELIGANGVERPLELAVRRDGAELVLTMTPVLSPTDGTTPVVGVVVSSDYEFPFEVGIQLENVGGPSAGLMFALGIYDLLTPGALTGGEHVAGTGTISSSGVVGAIGGVRQKLHAAAAAGAEWFLLAEANCAQALGAAPAGLEVVPVDDLDAAVAAVEAIADGGGAGLPRCPA